MNRESFTIVLEPLSEDGLRATALASKMGDEEKLRWWVGLARESADGWCRGAWAVEPGGRRKFVSDHWYTPRRLRARRRRRADALLARQRDVRVRRARG